MIFISQVKDSLSHQHNTWFALAPAPPKGTQEWQQVVCATQDERTCQFIKPHLWTAVLTAGETQYAASALELTPLRVFAQSVLRSRLSYPAAVWGGIAFSKTAHPAVLALQIHRHH